MPNPPRSNLLYSCLAVLNGSTLNDLRDHYRRPDQKPYPQGAVLQCFLKPAFGLKTESCSPPPPADSSTLLPDITSFLGNAPRAERKPKSWPTSHWHFMARP